MSISLAERTDQARPYVLGLLRIVTSLLFLCHGVASIFGVLGGAHGGGSLPAGQWPGWWAALIQLVAGAFVLLGLGTRVAALLCSGSMAYAYFTVHQEHALLPIQNGGELAVLFCWVFLAVAVSGPGALALDTLLRTRALRTGATPTARGAAGRDVVSARKGAASG